MLRCLPSLGAKSRVLEKGNTVCLAWGTGGKQSPTGVKAVPCLFLKTSCLSFISEFFWGAEVKAVVFPVVMYRCESWTIKKAECRRMDAFELWCWRRLLRVPWTARRSNQSILKEISPEYSLKHYVEAETPILWPPDAKNWLIWKDPDAGKDWRQEEKGTTEDEMVGQHHQINGHEFE